jgi:hypothetical protein
MESKPTPAAPRIDAGRRNLIRGAAVAAAAGAIPGLQPAVYAQGPTNPRRRK